MSNRLPSDDIKKANSHVSLEFRGEVQTGDTNLRVISMEAKDACHHQRLGERNGTDSPSELPEGTTPASTLI